MHRGDEVRVVDWQLFRYARPTTDLAYFFGSSLTPDFRAKHVDRLLKYYHLNLSKCLISLGYTEDTYPFNALMRDFEECYIYGIGMSVMHSTVC